MYLCKYIYICISTHTDKNINSVARNSLVDTVSRDRVSCAIRCGKASILTLTTDPSFDRSEVYFFLAD